MTTLTMATAAFLSPNAQAVPRTSDDEPCIITVGVEKNEKPSNIKGIKTAINTFNKHVDDYQFEYVTLPANSVKIKKGLPHGEGADVYLKSLNSKQFATANRYGRAKAFAGYYFEEVGDEFEAVGYLVLGPQVNTPLITHELGHVADLDHVSKQNSVMNPWVRNNAKLLPSDIRSLQQRQRVTAQRFCPTIIDRESVPTDSEPMPAGGQSQSHD